MAHEIETFDDGTAAFVSARTDAWHRLGTVTRDCLTAEQVMTTARLGGWNVHTVPLTATEITTDGVTTLPVPDHFATVRTHPVSGRPDVLGVVGSGYTVVQNEEHCELLEPARRRGRRPLRNRRLPARGPGDLRDHEAPAVDHPRRHERLRRRGAVPRGHVQPRRDRRLAGHRHPRAHRLRQHPAHGPAPREGQLRDPAHPLRPRQDRPGPAGAGHRLALRRGVRDRRPDPRSTRRWPWTSSRPSSTSSGPSPPARPRKRSARAPRASATAATPPCGACSPTPTPSTTCAAPAGPGCRPSPSTSTTTPPPRTTTSARPGCSPPTRSASASSAPTTCSPPVDAGSR